MQPKSEQDYIDYALKLRERGDSDEKIMRALTSQGLKEYDAKRFLTKAYKAVYLDEDRKDAMKMIYWGVLGIVATIVLMFAFASFAKSVGMRERPRFIITILTGIALASIGSIGGGIKKLRGD